MKKKKYTNIELLDLLSCIVTVKNRIKNIYEEERECNEGSFCYYDYDFINKTLLNSYDFISDFIDWDLVKE